MPTSNVVKEITASSQNEKCKGATLDIISLDHIVSPVPPGIL